MNQRGSHHLINVSSNQPPLLSQTALSIFKFLLGNRAAVLDTLFDLMQRIPVVKALPGMYEVLAYEATLELKDSKGKTAVYRKRQQVRFLQNNIIAFQDKAWGDGDIFADYQCSPGHAVDRYRDGHRYNILISLRETKHRDQIETFHIERTIKDGFTRSTEDFQTDIDHRTHQLVLKLIFPRNRLPTKVTLVEQNSQHTLALGEHHHHILPDGRHQYSWKTTRPRLYEAYILHWKW